MSNYFYSVIEGFYGRQWSWNHRRDYAGFLKSAGFEHYIYAPKGDQFLRSRWREQHPQSVWGELLSLSEYYHSQGVKWGVGFSPMGISEVYSKLDRQLLLDKVVQLNHLSPDIFCILFDDIRGDIKGLAQRQLDIVDDILSVSTASKHVVCPTYYSFDPVLEQVFGNMPNGYLSDLGAGLDNAVSVFWTGNKVISDVYEEADIKAVAKLLKRKPIIWDNYPVNDGRVTSQYLHLRPYSGRPSSLSGWAEGHVVNPMNQPSLSKIVLRSLQDVYKQKDNYTVDNSLKSSLALLSCEPLARQLASDLDLFQMQGLECMSSDVRESKINEYQNFEHVVADEVVDWLKNGYQFDPECLTG